MNKYVTIIYNMYFYNHKKKVFNWKKINNYKKRLFEFFLFFNKYEYIKAKTNKYKPTSKYR